MNPSSHPEPLDILIESARKGGIEAAHDDSVPFGLKTRVFSRVRESNQSESLTLWKQASLVLSGMSLAVVIMLSLGSEPSQAQPAAAILPLPSLDLGDAPTPVK